MIPKILHVVNLDPDQKLDPHFAQALRDMHRIWDVRITTRVGLEEGMELARYCLKNAHIRQAEDLARLDLVHKYGGIVLSPSVHLVRALDPLTQYDHFWVSRAGEGVSPFLFGAASGHPVIRSIIKHLLRDAPDWPSLASKDLFGKVISPHLRWIPDLNVLPCDTIRPTHEPQQTARTAGTYGTVQDAIAANAKRPAKPAIFKRIVHTSLAPVRALVRKLESRLAYAALRQARQPVPTYSFGADLIVSTTRGLKMVLPGSDLSLTPELALNGTYEEAEASLLERTLRPGDYFVDVGCNVGSHSLVAAQKVGRFGRVYSIDANRHILEYLKKSVVMNWMHDRTRILNAAVGNGQDDVELQFSAYRLGDASISLHPESTFHRTLAVLGAQQRLHVRQVRLDDLFPAPIEIKVMKIDVEGAEHAVLAGAQRLFANRCVEWLIMELLEDVAIDKHTKNLKAVEHIRSLGYDLGTIQGHGDYVQVADLETALLNSKNIVLHRRNIWP